MKAELNNHCLEILPYTVNIAVGGVSLLYLEIKKVLL